ncbi:MAG TPA: septation protein A [Paracoccaceae bacterium]|nr:septation protein A [Paracoccaceae bacterium]
MAARTLHPLVKLALELGPIGVFFLSYRWARVDESLPVMEQQLEQIMFATLVFMPTIIASVAIMWLLTRKVPRMALWTAIIVTIFGGLTLFLRDDTFVKMKPTINYSLFAAILGFGLLRGQSYLSYLMDELIPMARAGWMAFTRRIVVFWIVLAIVNEIVWRNFGTDAWVNFRTFVLPLANFAFIMSQMPLFQKHALPEKRAETR